MSKYIHYFTSESEFNEKYNSPSEILVNSIVCSATKVFSNVTFTYGGEEIFSGPEEITVYKWLNEGYDYPVYTVERNPNTASEAAYGELTGQEGPIPCTIERINGEEIEGGYVEPWVSLIEDGSIFRLNYNKNPKEVPLTIEITNTGRVKLNPAVRGTYEYKLNDGEWTQITTSDGSEEISVSKGNTIQLRGNIYSYGIVDGDTPLFSGTTCGFKVKGNIMSLINSTNYANLTSFPENTDSNFGGLFSNCTGLTDASELILPATTLTHDCYGEMFANCTSLTTAPVLPATTLVEGCYSNMFNDCTSLTTAPSILPATTLTNYCYSNMFAGCTSLTTAPELPATTLTDSCYSYMFYGCTSLTTAPELPATTLASNCYAAMFAGCTNLNYIKCLATDISANQCTGDWVSGVQTTSGQFITPSSTQWTTGESGIPSGWTRVDA